MKFQDRGSDIVIVTGNYEESVSKKLFVAEADGTLLRISGQKVSPTSFAFADITYPVKVDVTALAAELNVWAAGNDFHEIDDNLLSNVLSSGKIFRGNNLNLAVASTASFADTYGASELIYSNGANNVVGLATAINGVLITSGAGVPSISATLPSAVQDNITRLGTVVSGIWNGTAIGVAYGGTNIASYAVGDLIYASGATTLSKLADVAVGQILISGGVGVAPAWSASPTLTTSLTTPLLIGGTAVGSTLILKSTSGVGTTDAIIFQVGNNGATEAMRILSTGGVGIETATVGADKLRVVGIIRSVTDGPGLIATDSAITSSLYLQNDGTTGQIGYNKVGGDLVFSVGGAERVRLKSTGRMSIGGTFVGTEYLNVFVNQNAVTEVIITNETSGTEAGARIYNRTLTSNIITEALSAGYTTSGLKVASTGLVYSNFGNGLNVGTINSAQFSIWTNNTKRWIIAATTGNLSNTGSDGTAYIHLKAGTATASTAPLKFTSGTALTVAESGAVEYITGAFIMQSDSLSVGLATNSARVHIKGTGSTSATYGLQIHNSTGTNNAFIVRDDGNVGIGTSTFGTNAAKVLGIANGTAPTTSPADISQLWTEDNNAVAGAAGFHIRTENANSATASENKQIVVSAVIKATTGDLGYQHEGLVCINTFDNTAKIYADSGWRTIASGW